MDSHQQMLHQEIKEIRKDMRSLREEITKYKGFVGGVFWCFAAFITAANFAFTYIKQWVLGVH